MCNKWRGRKQDNKTQPKLKQRQEKRKAIEDAEFFSKLVMEMVK